MKFIVEYESIMKIRLINYTETEVLESPSHFVQHVIVVPNWLEPGNEQQNTDSEIIESPDSYFSCCSRNKVAV